MPGLEASSAAAYHGLMGDGEAGVLGGSVKTARFGEVSMDGVEVALMDGGVHGVQGHSLWVGSDGLARWARRLDGLHPAGHAGRGTFVLSSEERAWLEPAVARARAFGLAREVARAAERADAGRTCPQRRADPQPPRWVWAIILRHAGRPLLIEGEALARGDAPPDVEPLLAWLVARVDREAARPGWIPRFLRRLLRP